MNRLVLKERDLLGDGTERLCYLHPDREELCVKVCRPGVEARQHSREKEFFEKLDTQSRESKHLVRYHGAVATDLGEGLVFETVRDEDGSVSKSLFHYLRHAPEEIDERMLEALKELERFLLARRIVLKDPSPTNLLYRRGEKNETFVVIDGIAASLPRLPLLDAYARHRAKRQFAKVITRMRREVRKHPELLNLIDRYWSH